MLIGSSCVVLHCVALSCFARCVLFNILVVTENSGFSALLDD